MEPNHSTDKPIDLFPTTLDYPEVKLARQAGFALGTLKSIRAAASGILTDDNSEWRIKFELEGIVADADRAIKFLETGEGYVVNNG
jgi:hypothetical protein